MEDKKALINLMKLAGSENLAVAAEAGAEFAVALELPIKEAIFPGDLYSDLFTIEEYPENADVRYATDLIQPGREQEYVAYAVPRHGAPPERIVEQDYVRVATNRYFDSIEIPIPAMRQGDYNVLKRAMQILHQGAVMIMNNNCFHALTAAGVGRGFSVVDTAATAGQFSKTLLTNMQVKMRRATGSNASSVNGFSLGRIYMSPELRATISVFDNTKLDEVTRREVIMSPEGHIEKLFGTEIKDIVELGAAGQYQIYATTVQQFSFTNSKTELVIGVDLNKRDRLVLPVSKMPSVVDDSAVTRRRNIVSFFFDMNFGVGCLDDRVTFLGGA